MADEAVCQHPKERPQASKMSQVLGRRQTGRERSKAFPCVDSRTHAISRAGSLDRLCHACLVALVEWEAGPLFEIVIQKRRKKRRAARQHCGMVDPSITRLWETPDYITVAVTRLCFQQGFGTHVSKWRTDDPILLLSTFWASDAILVFSHLIFSIQTATTTAESLPP